MPSLNTFTTRLITLLMNKRTKQGRANHVAGDVVAQGATTSPVTWLAQGSHVTGDMVGTGQPRRR